MSTPSTSLQLSIDIQQRIAEATRRLEVAEHELTLAMEAITLPEHGADNEMVGERLRSALQELRAARQALALEQAAP